MTFELAPDALVRAGRVGVDLAADLRETGAPAGFGPTGVDDGAACERLACRVGRIAARIGANGRNLQELAREAEAVDSEVGLSFLVLSAQEWR